MKLRVKRRPATTIAASTVGIAMPVKRKVFRIEEMQLADEHANAAAAPFSHQHYILAELMALRELIERRSDGALNGASRSEPAAKPDAEKRSGNIEATGLRALKDETDTIQRAINRTKQEIAALHVNGLNAPETGRASRELDAVVGGAEHAIQQILAAAEDIDEAANTLSAALKHEQEQALAHDIRDQVIRIFEACNFQDLAGQRITKVTATLKFIEDRVTRMMEIWGGIEAFKDYTAAALAEREPGPVLLNGPKLDGDTGHATQDQIDAIFKGQ
jgi:chemotaxis protein CheZ